MTWRYHVDTGTDGTVHVWPQTDTRPHITEGGSPCWCAPEPEFHDNGAVLVLHRDQQAAHRHLIVRHRHPDWHGHCDSSKRGYKPCDRFHWHLFWRHAHG